MLKREDRVRIDKAGMVHPVGRDASQELRHREGDWRLMAGPDEAMLLVKAVQGRSIRMAGEIASAGGLADMAAVIAQSKWRGELVVVSDAGTRVLYIDGGNLVQGRTTVPEERIGEILYRFGVLGREDLDAVLAAAESSGKRVGEMAIELGLFSADELYRMMSRQVEEIFYGALYERQATFYFFDGFDEQAIWRKFSLNAFTLLMEGARRVDELKYFREKIPAESYIPLAVSLRPPGESGASKTPPEELQAIYTLCDGSRSIADIGREMGQLEFEVTRNVYQLMTGGFVKLVGARPDGPGAIVEAFNSALSTIHKTCDDAGKGADLRSGLARFATGGGVYDPLFLGAGPLEDGSLLADRVERNIQAFAGGDANQWLLQLMNDYVGFALFHAESLLPREAERVLVDRVTAILKPLAPLLEASSASATNAKASAF